jgi:hypothetical protein
MPELPTVPGLVDVMTTVEAGVVMGHLAFPAATTSPFSTTTATSAAVTTLLAWLLMMILGRR